MLFDLIFLSLFFVGWSICGFLSWLAVSVATRGNAGLGMLPLCVFAAIVTALAVPLFVSDGWTGVWLSFVVALVVPSGLMGLRRFASDARALTPADPTASPVSGIEADGAPRATPTEAPR